MTTARSRRNLRLLRALGLAGLAGVAATGAVVVRAQRRRRAVTADELRERLHERLDAAQDADSEQAE
jgi:hypothetical protein